MRRLLMAAWLLAVPLAPAMADVHLSINLGGFPNLQPIPGYPVYYAPSVSTNYFFYDGLYWVYDGDNWYSSSWYNGPWQFVDPFAVPVYLLRVPVRYYRHPPAYFRSWRADAPPRWDQHWGNDWAERHRGWDRWDRHENVRPAPLPTYQREYRGNRYPDAQRQAELHQRHYSYRPQEGNYSYRAPQGRAPQVRPQEGRPQDVRPGNPQYATPREQREMDRNQMERKGTVGPDANAPDRLQRDRDRQGGGG